MKNLFKILLASLLISAFVLGCSGCQNTDTPANNNGGGNQVTDSFNDEASTYRIRFVYSYTAKVENSSGRLENKQSIVTVASYYVSKDNPVVSDDMLAEMKALTYHGFNFVKWYSEWDVESQKGVEGKEFTFGQPITSDITLFCDRGDLAGENISWAINTDESGEVVLELKGSGEMFDFVGANEIDVPWYSRANEITKVVVSDGITSIGNHAFHGLSKVKTVDLPDTVERIGLSAFEDYGATKFVAPKSLKVIEKNAFVDTSLREVVLNEGLTTLGERAFYGSNKIKTIVFPSTVKSIPVAAFHPGTINNKNNKHSLSKVYYLGDADNFKSVDIGMDNTWFADKATVYFYRESLAEDEVGTYWHYVENTTTAVQYFYTLRYIQGSAKTFLCNIYVPVRPVYNENNEMVYDEDGLPMLSGVITDEHVREQAAITYHNYQFSGFSGADTLRAGMVISSDVVYTCQRGNILSPDGGVKWAFSNGKLTIYVDTETEQRITKDVESRIKDGRLVLTDAEKKILNVTDDEVEVTDEVKATIISGRLENSLYMWDFEESYDATSIWTSSTTSIVVEDGVKYIGRYAFSGISRTSEIVIPESVKGIHADAFSGCTDLISVYYNGVASAEIIGLSNSRYTVYSKVEAATAALGNYWMDINDKGVMRRIAWSIDADGKLTVGGDSKMFNFASAADAPWYGAKSVITSVSFAENIYSIGENVVNGYSNVTELYIPVSTRKIPASAFAGTGIVRNTDGYKDGALVINGHLIKVDPTAIEKNLFETYTGIVTIAEGAFDGCTHINSLYIARTIQYIDATAFKGCSVDAIFVDGNIQFWSIIDEGVDFPDSKVYFKHTDKYITITNESGKTETVLTSSISDTYWFKCGSEYVIWGNK